MNNTEFRGEKTYSLKFCLKYYLIKKHKDRKTQSKYSKLLIITEPKGWVYEVHYPFFIFVHVYKLSD